MTLSEFYSRLEYGATVVCRTPQRRNEMVEFICESFGLKVGPRTEEYMSRHPNEGHTCVELYLLGREMVVTLCAHATGSAICFEDVMPLMAATNTPLDTRTDEEFLEAFTELIS